MLYQTSELQNYQPTNKYCFKPLHFHSLQCCIKIIQEQKSHPINIAHGFPYNIFKKNGKKNEKKGERNEGKLYNGTKEKKERKTF